MSNLGLSLKSLKPPRASRLCSSTQAPRWSTRRLHLRSPLKYRIDEGLGEFLPPPALKTVAVDYQQGLLQRLNEEVRGEFVVLVTLSFPFAHELAMKYRDEIRGHVCDRHNNVHRCRHFQRPHVQLRQSGPQQPLLPRTTRTGFSFSFQHASLTFDLYRNLHQRTKTLLPIMSTKSPPISVPRFVAHTEALRS